MNTRFLLAGLLLTGLVASSMTAAADPHAPTGVPAVTQWPLGDCNGTQDTLYTFGRSEQDGGPDCGQLFNVAGATEAIVDAVINRDPAPVIGLLPELPSLEDLAGWGDGYSQRDSNVDLR